MKTDLDVIKRSEEIVEKKTEELQTFSTRDSTIIESEFSDKELQLQRAKF